MMKKRVLSLLLCLALCLSLLPAAFAEDIRIVDPAEDDASPWPGPSDEIAVVPAPDAEILAGGSCGSGVSWSLDTAGTLTISGSGKMNDYTLDAHAPWWSSRSSVKKLSVEGGVTHVGAYAFYECNYMTKAEIDAEVHSLGEGAFYCCTGLVKLSFPGTMVGSAPAQPNGIPAEPLTGEDDRAIGDLCFYGCSALRGTVLCSSFNRIGEYAFADCVHLEELDFGWGGSIDIDYCAFRGCSSLKSVYMNAAVIGPYAFADCTSLEEVSCYSFFAMQKNFTAIGYSAFANCVSLESFKVPDYVTEVGSQAFSGCTGLRTVTLGGALQTLGQQAFSGCTALADVVFQGFVPQIGSESFRGVSAAARYPDGLDWTATALQNYGGSLSWQAMSNKAGQNVTWTATKDGRLTLRGSGEVVFPSEDWADYKHLRAIVTQADVGSGITSVGGRAFTGMTEMTGISLPATLTEIGIEAFVNCSRLESVTIPEGVTRIGGAAFRYCESLGQITVPNSVTEIGDEAFYVCEKLRSLRLGSGLQVIGPDAFAYCKSLPELTVPGGVTRIGDRAFGSCSALTTVRFEGPAPEFDKEWYNETSYCFSGVTATVYYPAGEASWTADKRLDYGGHLTWTPYTPAGYSVRVVDCTGGRATASIGSGSYSGSQSFTVTSADDRAVAVIVKVGESYTTLKCTTSGGKHNFTVTVSADMDLLLVFKGDANLDGKVNMRDSLAIKKHTAGTELLTGTALYASDADGNGKYNMRDSLAIKKDTAGTEKIKW